MATCWKVEVQGLGCNLRRLRENERFVLEFDSEETALAYINELIETYPNQFSTTMYRSILCEKKDIAKLIGQTLRFFS